MCSSFLWKLAHKIYKHLRLEYVCSLCGVRVCDDDYDDVQNVKPKGARRYSMKINWIKCHKIKLNFDRMDDGFNSRWYRTDHNHHQWWFRQTFRNHLFTLAFNLRAKVIAIVISNKSYSQWNVGRAPFIMVNRINNINFQAISLKWFDSMFRVSC